MTHNHILLTCMLLLTTPAFLYEASLAQSSVDARDAAELDILLVDDQFVLYRSGTKRTLHQALSNASNPVVTENQPWEMAIAWTSIYRDPNSGKYQLWYQAYAGKRANKKTHECVVCYAESQDGVRFVKPNLGIHRFNDIQDTNIVLIGTGGYGDRYCNSVVVEPAAANAARRYKMLYYDFFKNSSGREYPGWNAAFSADGRHWTKSSHAPLNKTSYGGRSAQPPFADEEVYVERFDQRKNFLRKTWKFPLGMSDAVDVFRDPIRQRYVVYGKCWLHGPAGGMAWKHGMARVESKNFLDWSKPQIVLAPDDNDHPNLEFHNSPVFFYKGCYFSLNQILKSRAEVAKTTSDLMHIELMISRDGFKWERPFRATPFFKQSGRENFSSGSVFTNSAPVILDNEIRFYYGGYSATAVGGGSSITGDSQESGVGFATIPLDRFAGIRPVELSAQSTLKRPLENIGQITLKPIDLRAYREITINADAGAGSVRVEVLNEDGYRMRGFSRQAAIAIRGDSLQHPVRWKDRSLRDLPPGNYMLRVHLENAEVFALTFR